MNDKRNLIAQWAFDTRPLLLRFHLWLEDVEVERSQDGPVSAVTFTPRGIARCLAMTSAATALGTRLFGDFGAGAGKDKVTYNQFKKSADAISAYAMSEGLWSLTRTLPENHAVMVSLGEGLMPKAGETPEMGANPLLGFGRVYARPEVAKTVDRRVRRLLNEPGHTFEQFHGWLKNRGITLWGAAVDTLECTSRFAEGKATGPMTVLHLFDSPLKMARPYESYIGCLTVPRRVTAAAEASSVLLDYRTPRKQVVECIEKAYPGIRRENIHVWTLRGKSRETRLRPLWDEWTALGVNLVDDGWKTPSGIAVFTDSGTYAPTFLVGSFEVERAGARLSLRRIRRVGRGNAGGQPLRGARRRRHHAGVLVDLRAADRSRGPRHGRRWRFRRRREDGRALQAGHPRCTSSPTSRWASAFSARMISSPRRTGACWRASATCAMTRTQAHRESSRSATASTE